MVRVGGGRWAGIEGRGDREGGEGERESIGFHQHQTPGCTKPACQ
jgi:hypothetical protein